MWLKGQFLAEKREEIFRMFRPSELAFYRTTLHADDPMFAQSATLILVAFFFFPLFFLDNYMDYGLAEDSFFSFGF